MRTMSAWRLRSSMKVCGKRTECMMPLVADSHINRLGRRCQNVKQQSLRVLCVCATSRENKSASLRMKKALTWVRLTHILAAPRRLHVENLSHHHHLQRSRQHSRGVRVCRLGG